MKIMIRIIAGCLMTAAFFSVCEHDKGITGGKSKTDFSGVYCLDALNATMTVIQKGDSVRVMILADHPVSGAGLAAGDSLSFTGVIAEGDTIACRLFFSKDRLTFSGKYRMTNAAGRDTSGGVLKGSKGQCPSLDIAADGIPEFVTHDFTQLSKIRRISKFRSAMGHDYSDGVETCRSMKHYYSAVDSLRKNNAIEIYSPVDGSIITVSNDGHGASVGLNNKQIQIRPDVQPAFIIRLFHCDLVSAAVVEGKKVQAGELIAHARLFYEDLGEHSDSFDIAVWVNTQDGMRLVPYPDIMMDKVFNDYILRGAHSRQDFVISKEARDADPLQCNGEAFISSGHLEDWVVLN